MGDVSFAVLVLVFISQRHSRTHTSEGVRAAPAVLLAPAPMLHMRKIRRKKKRRKQSEKDIEEEALRREGTRGRGRAGGGACTCVFVCTREKRTEDKEGKKEKG